MSLESITPANMEAGAEIARRGAELAQIASQIGNVMIVGEDSLAGGIAGLARQERTLKEIRNEQVNTIAEAEMLIGGILHDVWRNENFATEDTAETGTYSTRVKCLVMKDGKEKWVNEKDVEASDAVLFRQDIANTSFPDLHEYWQKDNLEAAKEVVSILVEADGHIDLSNPEVYEAIGDRIHSAWLKRASWVEPGLEKPFNELSSDQQEKDINQLRAGIAVFPQAQ